MQHIGLWCKEEIFCLKIKPHKIMAYFFQFYFISFTFFQQSFSFFYFFPTNHLYFCQFPLSLPQLLTSLPNRTLESKLPGDDHKTCSRFQYREVSLVGFMGWILAFFFILWIFPYVFISLFGIKILSSGGAKKQQEVLIPWVL